MIHSHPQITVNENKHLIEIEYIIGTFNDRDIKYRGPLNKITPPILYEQPHNLNWSIRAWLVDQ